MRAIYSLALIISSCTAVTDALDYRRCEISSGGFAVEKSVPLPGTSSIRNIVVGDFNADHKADILVTSAGDNTFTVLNGVGDGTFGTATSMVLSTASANPSGVVTADVNNDGIVDVIIANTNSPSFEVLLGQVSGGFKPSTADTGMSQLAVAEGDFNGDGKIDLAFAVDNAAEARVVFGKGDGTFGTPQTISGVGNSESTAVIAADFNHDGFSDLAFAHVFPSDYDVTLLLAKSDGSGTFSSPVALPTATPSSKIRLRSADFNGDGNLDLAITDSFPEIEILLGDGKGNFKSKGTTPLTGCAPGELVVTDINGDGKLDLATNCYDEQRSDPVGVYSNSVAVLLGKGDATFPSFFIFPVGNGPTAIARGAFTSDCLPDLVTANAVDISVSVLLSSRQITPTVMQ